MADRESTQVPAECTEVIDTLLKKLASVAATADARRARRLAKISELKQAAHQPFFQLGTALVTKSHGSNSATGEETLLAARAGEMVDILLRASSWTYCRIQGSDAAGWLPADGVAEMATLTEEQESSGSDGLFGCQKGERVEVLSWHYSGWAFCREWDSGSTEPSGLKTGWICDRHLDDGSSQNSRRSRWQISVYEELDRIMAGCSTVEGLLASLRKEGAWAGSVSEAALGRCVELSSSLASELQLVTDAESQLEQSASAAAQAAPPEKVATDAQSQLEMPSPTSARAAPPERVDRRSLEQVPVELPAWIRPGNRCLWWSTSERRFFDVEVDSIDRDAQVVRFAFTAEGNLWKCLPFKHFAQPRVAWRVRPSHPDAGAPADMPSAFAAAGPSPAQSMGAALEGLGVALAQQQRQQLAARGQHHRQQWAQGLAQIGEESEVLRKARRLAAPEAWDSEAEEPLDTAGLAEEWPQIAHELDLISAAEVADLEARLVTEIAQGASSGGPDTLQARSRVLERRLCCRKEVLRGYLGEDPVAPVLAIFLPDTQDLMGVPVWAAVAEAAIAAQELFQALQVAALRPAVASGWRAAAAEQGALEAACSPAAKRLQGMLAALEATMSAAVAAAAPASGLPAHASSQDLGGSGPEPLSDEHAVREAEGCARGAVASVHRALLRRWRRQKEHDKAYSLEQLAELNESLAGVAEQLEMLRREQRERAELVREQFEREQRRAHRQAQALLAASAAVADVKRRRAEATVAPSQEERRRLLGASLQRVLQLKREFQDLDLAPELKQRHAVLLYSLRILEGQLKKEAPQGADAAVCIDLAERPGAADRQALAEADAAFEAALDTELAAFEASYRQHSDSQALRLSATLRREVDRRYGDTIHLSRLAVRKLGQEAARVDSAVQSLGPFSVTCARLEVEALRHRAERDCDREPRDDAAPPRRSVEAPLRATAAVAAELRATAAELSGTAGTAAGGLLERTSPAPRVVDAEWEAALAEAERRWEAFCVEHPAAASGEVEMEVEAPVAHSVFDNGRFGEEQTWRPQSEGGRIRRLLR